MLNRAGNGSRKSALLDRKVDMFTALHRALGLGSCPLSDEMINDTVAQQLPEGADLDFKRALPEANAVVRSDFPKDIAAMRNSGGGTIIYGISETDKRATGRTDVELSETHERTLRQVANSAITPPVLDLRICRLGSAPHRCVAVTVPPSSDPNPRVAADRPTGRWR